MLTPSLLLLAGICFTIGMIFALCNNLKRQLGMWQTPVIHHWKGLWRPLKCNTNRMILHIYTAAWMCPMLLPICRYIEPITRYHSGYFSWLHSHSLSFILSQSQKETVEGTEPETVESLWRNVQRWRTNRKSTGTDESRQRLVYKGLLWVITLRFPWKVMKNSRYIFTFQTWKCLATL